MLRDTGDKTRTNSRTKAPRTLELDMETGCRGLELLQGIPKRKESQLPHTFPDLNMHGVACMHTQTNKGS